MIEPGRDELISAMVARFLRRVAAASAAGRIGRHRHKKDDPWPGRLFDPLPQETPTEGGPPPPPPDGPDSADPNENNNWHVVNPDTPHDPPGFDDPDENNQWHVVVQDLMGRNPPVVEHVRDDLQPVYTVGAIATDWTQLRGTWTAPGADTLKITANGTGTPLGCAIWKWWNRYTDVQASCTLYDTAQSYGFWLCAADDGTGKVNGYNVQRSLAGLLSVYRYTSNVGTLLATLAAAGLVVGERLVGVRRGSKVAIIAVNAGLVASATDSTYTTGSVGVGGGVFQAVNGEYRDFTISQATAA